MAKRKTSVERLVERLRDPDELNIPVPEGYRFERLRPGHWGRAAGAWSWHITDEALQIGSPDSVGDCLKSDRLEMGPHGTIYAN